MASDFIHLHTHSHYSLLSALPKIDELVKAAKDNNMDALALTDNANLYGAIEFYKACKKAGIKPIIGIDAYVSARNRFDKQAGIDNRRTRLILLAENLNGYKNLIKLSTDSNLEGFYYKPRVDRELLEKYKNGLIAILPSFSGDIAMALRYSDKEKALEKLKMYREIFGADNLFMEITHHPEINGHEELMENIIKFAKENKTPLVAAHDVYYLAPDDRKARETLVAVQSHSDFSDRENNEADFSFVGEKEIKKWFKDIPEAITNTKKIAGRCNFDLDLGKWVFPDFKLPNGEKADEALRALAYAGIEKRNLKNSPEIKQRVDYELDVIKKKGYAPYFLVVSDLLRHAKEVGILSTTRGSAGGSMVSYLSYITTVNPMEYGLPFERFLNYERPSPPDVDMDIADNRRDQMIEYAKQKYGADKVAQVGTFGTMMARGAVRDVARALGYEYSLGDQIAKLIPIGSQGFPMTLDRAFEIVPELKQLYNANKDVKEIIDTSKKIEGCARHVSVHAAGVVISPTPLTDFAPLQFDPKGEGKIITQYDMYSIEEAGLLKFDFLGIKNLSILSDAIERVKKIEGVEIDLDNIPLDDKKTFEMLANGETIGVFQLNGEGMTHYLKDLKPTSINDINAMVALYRPGPMESIPQYIERKHNPRLVQYLDPRMKDILNASYGVLTYQDDVLLIAIKIAGYSWTEADKLRKAMGKKIPKEMQEQKEKLIQGAIKNGLNKEKADRLWALIEPFAAYGFNKCLTGDAKIIDAETGKISDIKSIFEYNIKQQVFSLEKNHTLNRRKISKAMENGIKTVYKLKTRSGKTIRTTDNHPFLKFSGWAELKKLKIGDKIATPRTLEKIVGKKVSDYKPATLGYLLSEGNLCHPAGIYFYSTQKDELEDFKKYASLFKNISFKENYDKSTTSVYAKQINQKNGNSLNIWIKSLGLKNIKATEKFIPECVFEWNKKALSILIGKMWQGDGCVSIKNQQIYYATSSKILAENTQHILLRLGIISAIHTKQFKYRGQYKTGYTIVVSSRQNLLIFSKTAGGYLIGKKRKDLKILVDSTKHLNKYPARGTNDIIPAEILNLVRIEMIKRGVSAKQLAKITGLAPRLFFADSRKIGFQREVIRKIGKALKSEELLSHANSDIYWDEIVSIAIDGKEMTYDVTVPASHNFIANDIIVHNSHAASYGRVAYQTAYMKANFPAIYMSSVLSADSGDVEKIGETIVECKRMGIPVLPPSINESFSAFTVVKANQSQITGNSSPSENKDKIRFGLTTIKNFGEGISHSIIEERKRGGKFKSLGNFLSRVKGHNLNKKSLEALIKAGALDEFGERGIMLANMERLLSFVKESSSASADQTSLFGTLGMETSDDLKLEPAPEASQTDKLAWEKELLGLYISGHPLDKFRAVLEKREVNIKKAREEMREGMLVVIGGIIEEMRPIITKKNEPMAFMKLSDLSGTIEVVVFPSVMEKHKDLLKQEACVALKGKISYRNNEVSIIAEKFKPLV